MTYITDDLHNFFKVEIDHILRYSLQNVHKVEDCLVRDNFRKISLHINVALICDNYIWITKRLFFICTYSSAPSPVKKSQ